MQRDLRRHLAAQLHHAKVLDDKRVHIAGRRRADQLGSLGHFPIAEQRVERQVNLYAANVTILYRLAQFIRREIPGTLPRIAAGKAKIDRIGAVLDRCPQRIHRAGGG